MNTIIWFMLVAFLGGALGQNDIIIPVLQMPLANTQLFRPWSTSQAPELGKKFTAIHLAEKEPSNYNIDKLYSTKIIDVANYIQSHYMYVGNPPPASSLSDINYYWSTNIPRNDIKGTSLEGNEMVTDYTFGGVQEMMLTNISRKMSIELPKVAVRLGVPTRNLSYSYDPAKWEEVVHAMVAEGIVSYVSLLELGTEDRLAGLVSLTLIQLKNVTIDGFLSLLPPFLPKKTLLDKNKTSEVMTFTGISSSSADALIYKLVNLTTQLTKTQFGILYNLTADQQRATERSTLLQLSQTCGISMSVLLDKTIPSIVWDTLGNMATSAPCSTMLNVKGQLISSFGLTNVQQMTVLQILLGICNQYWKSCRLTMTLEPSEWECLDSVTLSEAATVLSTTDAALQGKPVHDVVLGMSQKCKDGSHSLAAYRQKTSNTLQTLFNLTASQVQTLLGIGSGPYAAYTSAQLVEAYLNASSLDLKISLDTMFNTTSKTLQELYNSPTSELHEIIPFILRSAIKSPASELQVSDACTFTLLGLFADNSTIADLRFAIQNLLPPIFLNKTKFDNETLSVCRIHPLFKCRETMHKDIVLTKAESTGVSVSSIGKQNVLQILMMMCSDVSMSNMSLVMGWGPDDMKVLGNYTMEDAALCKRMSVKDVISRTLMALVTMILNEVQGCVIVPCRSGTVLDRQTSLATFLAMYWWLFLVFAIFMFILFISVLLLIKKLKPSSRSDSQPSRGTENMELGDYEEEHQVGEVTLSTTSLAAAPQPPDINRHQREDELTENVGTSLESFSGLAQDPSVMHPTQHYEELGWGTPHPQALYESVDQKRLGNKDFDHSRAYESLQSNKASTDYQSLATGFPSIRSGNVGTTLESSTGLTQDRSAVQQQHYQELKRGTNKPQALYESHDHNRMGNDGDNKETISESRPYEPLQANKPVETEYQSLTGYPSTTDSKV